MMLVGFLFNIYFKCFKIKFKRIDVIVHSSLQFSEKETDHKLTYIGY